MPKQIIQHPDLPHVVEVDEDEPSLSFKIFKISIGLLFLLTLVTWPFMLLLPTQGELERREIKQRLERLEEIILKGEPK